MIQRYRKKIITILSILLVVFSTLTIITYFNYPRINNYLKKEGSKSFAYYVQKRDKSGYENLTSGEFPKGYSINYENTKCYDYQNNEIDNINDVITMNDNKVSVKSNKTIYCSIYLDRVPQETVLINTGGESLFNDWISQAYGDVHFVDYIIYDDDDENTIIAQYDTSVTESGDLTVWLDEYGDLYIGSETTIHANEDASGMFQYINTSVMFFENFDTSSVTDMSGMFEGSGVAILDLSNWNVENVTKMSYMFADAMIFDSLNLSGLNASKVEDMSYMFCRADISQTVDLNDFDTSSVKNMSYMFYDSLNSDTSFLRGFKTDSVTDMSAMFSDNSTIDTLDLSSWNTKNVTDMSFMFENCTNLSNIIGIGGWNTKNVENMVDMFSGCSNLTKLDIEEWNVESVTDMSGMFFESGIIDLDLSSWNTENVENITVLFLDCKKLKTLNLSGWNLTNVTSASDTFSGTSQLKKIDLSNITTSEDTDVANFLTSMHESSSYLADPWDCIIEEIDFSNSTWKLSDISAYYIYQEFAYYSDQPSLKILKMSNIDTSGITYMSNMFWGASSLITADLSGWDTSNVISMKNVFAGCINLESLNLSGWDTSSVTDMSYMFSGCSNLADLNSIYNWDTSSVTDMSYMFSNCTNLKIIDLSNWNSEQVSDMSSMFENCSNLNNINLKNWTLNSLPMSGMSRVFYDCTNLQVVDMRDATFSSHTPPKSPFEGGVIYQEYVFEGVPTTAVLVVKDETEKQSITTNIATYYFNGTVKTAAEYDAIL